MSRTRVAALAFCTFVAAVAALPPHQARPQSAGKPFQRVNVTRPPALNDPSFTAFRENLAAVAKGRVFEELARNVVTRGFFWDRDFADNFDDKKTGAENLAAAVRLEQESGTGWQMLAEFAADPTATEIPTAPGVLCAPGRPSFAQDDFDRLVEATHSTAADWVFPRREGVELRQAPRPAGTLVETLGSYFVRMIRFDVVGSIGDPLRISWARVAAPSGKAGFAPPDSLLSLSAPQLCYVKDVTGRWRITGFIGGGN
ncbi:MAG TPA: hypothetical protein VK430_12230 [Xanthobacteraceae bacterium]|nr:hypothetical protein [Xanthobacteraceae bacterium]